MKRVELFRFSRKESGSASGSASDKKAAEAEAHEKALALYEEQRMQLLVARAERSVVCAGASNLKSLMLEV